MIQRSIGVNVSVPRAYTRERVADRRGWNERDRSSFGYDSRDLSRLCLLLMRGAVVVRPRWRRTRMVEVDRYRDRM